MPVAKTIPECFHFLEYGYQFNINGKQNTGKVKKSQKCHPKHMKSY